MKFVSGLFWRSTHCAVSDILFYFFSQLYLFVNFLLTCAFVSLTDFYWPVHFLVCVMEMLPKL